MVLTKLPYSILIIFRAPLSVGQDREEKVLTVIMKILAFMW
jgi:hypothetical protein